MHWRSRLPALAGAAAGVAVAAVLTLLQSSTYQADASIVLVRQGQPPGSDPALAQAADAAAGLFHSRAVAEPAIANLRLDESADELLDRFSVDTEPESSLVRISVEAPSRDEARRTAQELTELSTVLFNDRFGPADGRVGVGSTARAGRPRLAEAGRAISRWGRCWAPSSAPSSAGASRLWAAGVRSAPSRRSHGL